MEFRSYLSILTTIFILGFSCNSEMQQSEEDQSFNINSTPVKVNAEVFGQSCSHMFEVNPESSSLLTEKIRKLNVPFLRFPGGTESNYYHFFGKGNGLKKEDIDLSIGKQVHPKMMIRLKKEEKLIEDGKVQKNYAHLFAKLVQDLETDVVLVMNIFSSDDNENLALLDFFVQKGIKVRGIELGNENYFKAYDSVFPDASEYIKRSKRLTEKIKNLYPKIPVAATAANPPFNTGFSLKSRFRNWNEQLAKEDFYDGIVNHFYPKTTECDSMEDIAAKFDCALNTSLSKSDQMFEEGFGYFKEVYGPDIMLWITEYNVKEVFRHYGNSAMQALYDANFIIEILNRPEVEKAIYHNLYSNSFGYAMLSRKKQDVLERVPYQVFKLFSELERDAVIIPEVNLTSDENVKTLLVYSEEKQEFQCFMVNKGNSASNIDFSNYLKNIDLNVRGFHADNLMSSMGMSAVRKDEVWNDIHFFDKVERSESIEIPAYSFSYLSMNTK